MATIGRCLLRLTARVVVISAALFLVACATGHCQGRHPAGEKHIYVFKPDGSKQCTPAAAGETLEKMAKDLREIQIYSKESRLDGKPRIALCGSPTGRINVYEIGETDAARAKLYGFLPVVAAEPKK